MFDKPTCRDWKWWKKNNFLRMQNKKSAIRPLPCKMLDITPHPRSGPPVAWRRRNKREILSFHSGNFVVNLPYVFSRLSRSRGQNGSDPALPLFLRKKMSDSIELLFDNETFFVGNNTLLSLTVLNCCFFSKVHHSSKNSLVIYLPRQSVAGPPCNLTSPSGSGRSIGIRCEQFVWQSAKQ